MLRPRWRKLLRDFSVHRGRTLLVVAAMVVGLAGSASVLDAWLLLRAATRGEFLASRPASATFTMDVVDSAVLSAVREMPEIADVQVRRTVTGSAQRADGTWAPAVIFVASDLAHQAIGRLTPQRGEWPPANGAIAIENSSTEFAGSSAGDSLRLRLGGRELDVPIRSVVRDVGLAPGWMDHVVYLFASPQTMTMFGVPSTPDQLQILVRDRTLDRSGVRAVARRVRDVVRAQGHSVLSVDVPEPGRHVHAAQMDSLLMTEGAFGIVSLFMSGLLVVNLLTALLARQIREIGIMKTVGAEGGQLAAMYFGLAASLGLITSLMAIPTAALGGRLYAGFSAAMLNTTVDGYVIPVWAIALQVALGIALPCVAAAIPIARGIRVPVAVALRDVGIEASDAPQWLNRVRGPSRPALLSLRNAFRRRARMAFTVITLAMGGAAFLGALDLRTSIRGSVDFVYGTLLRYDASVRLTRAHDIDSLEAIARRLPEVVWAEAWNTAQVIIPAEQDLGGSFVATAVPVDTRLVALPIREGRWLVRQGLGEIVVSGTLVEEHPELALGRRVRLLVDGRTADWLVVGVADAAGPGPTAFVSQETLSRSRGRHDAGTVAFRMRGETPDARTSAIISVRDAFERAQISVASSQTLDATRHAIEDHLLMVAGFLLVMAQLTIVIGGLGLGSTMSVSVLERTREIGVLRAIGASRASIVALIETEGLVVALLSWLAAVPLSLPISVGVARAFGRIFFPVPVTLTPQPMALALWLIVAVLAAIVSCAWPALRATRVTIANALAYE